MSDLKERITRGYEAREIAREIGLRHSRCIIAVAAALGTHNRITPDYLQALKQGGESHRPEDILRRAGLTVVATYYPRDFGVEGLRDYMYDHEITARIFEEEASTQGKVFVGFLSARYYHEGGDEEQHMFAVIPDSEAQEASPKMGEILSRHDLHLVLDTMAPTALLTVMSTPQILDKTLAGHPEGIKVIGLLYRDEEK